MLNYNEIADPNQPTNKRPYQREAEIDMDLGFMVFQKNESKD